MTKEDRGIFGSAAGFALLGPFVASWFFTPKELAFWVLAGVVAVSIPSLLLVLFYLLVWIGENSSRPLATRDDPVFGTIDFHRRRRSKKRTSEVWRGEVEFGPTKTEISLGVQAPETGPTEAHRQLFREIEDRYEALLPALIEQLHQYWTEKQLDYELTGVDLEAIGPPATWTAHFTAEVSEDYEISFFATVVDGRVERVMSVD